MPQAAALPGEPALGGRAPSGSPAPAGELGTSGLGPWHHCGCPAQGAKAWSWGTGCCYSLPWRERLQALCASGGHDPSKGPHKTAAGLPPRNGLHSAGPRHLPGQLQLRTASARVPGPPVRHRCPRWAPHPGAGPASTPVPNSRQDGQAPCSALRPHQSPPLRCQAAHPSPSPVPACPHGAQPLPTFDRAGGDDAFGGAPVAARHDAGFVEVGPRHHHLLQVLGEQSGVRRGDLGPHSPRLPPRPAPPPRPRPAPSRRPRAGCRCPRCC